MEKSEQNQLLDKMLSFYKKRYTGKELENKFNSACEDVIISGDLSQVTYMSFCMDNNIEPIIKKKNKPSKSSDDYNYGGCGRSSYKSSC